VKTYMGIVETPLADAYAAPSKDVEGTSKNVKGKNA
jgi:hypothetical protein